MSKSITLRVPTFKKVPKKILLGSFLVIAIFIGLHWYHFYSLIVFQDEGQREAARIAHSVSGRVQLPKNEDPALAIIKDKKVINRGGVLADAENGDRILLYYKSGKAVLYRPSNGKIVAIGPLVLDASASQVKGTKVVVRNGSGVESKAASALKLLNDRYEEANISNVDEAGRSDYPSTIVVDLSEDGEKNEFAGAMIELLGARKGILPQGESKPNADILVIIGKDYRE